MKTLVTGGTGFVGSHLIERLINCGVEVVALVRSRSRRDRVESLGAGISIGDLDDETALRAACTGCDVVIHAAARVEIVGSEEEFHQTTVGGTERLLNAAKACGVGRFVYVSSCGVYHPALLASGQVIDESTATPEPPAWFPYGRAKYRAEQVVRRVAPPDLEWVIVRLGYLFGPRNRAMRSYLQPVMRDSVMMIIGDGSNEMALVDVRDAVAAVVEASRCPSAAGRVLIAAGFERITQREYFDALADGFGMPRITKHVPYRVAYFFGWLGERLARKEPRRSVMRRSAVALTGLPQRVRCDATQALLGWQPRITFEEGMRDAFDWFHREYEDGRDHASS